MITEIVTSEPSVASQIHTLAQVAYALEADQIGCIDFPPLCESLEELQRSSDRFLAFRYSVQIVGVLSFDETADPVTITRLVVSPAHLRQGIATALLTELARLLPRSTRLSVATAQANAPAVALYRRFGFTAASVTTSAEVFLLLRLTKTNDRDGVAQGGTETVGIRRG